MSIVINIKDTKNKANKVSELAVKTQKVSTNQLDDVCQNISSVWTGEGANRYKQKVNKLSTRVKNRGKNLSNLSSNLYNAADKHEKLEEFAKSLFLGKK